ncbi:MAG: hypothetical protein E7167_03145 [Firmicutes bacterium]|nr:hypothetical protein [Bacillota bacterium]
MNKLRNLILFFLCIFVLFIVVSLTPKNYVFKYDINKIKITESYKKKEKIYLFKIEKGNKKFVYSLAHKYIKKRGLLDKAIIKDNCLNVKSKILNDFSVCKENDNYYTTYAYEDVGGNIKDTFQLVDIYDLKEKKFYIWNYTEMLAINEKEKKQIELFDKDVYELEIITKLNNHLVIADYNQKYKFNKLYLINSKNNEVKESNLNKDIYFNSYILGTHKKNIYLYDLQTEKEYKINPFKEEIAKNAYQIRVNQKWEAVSVNKLNKKNVEFKDDKLFEYFLENDKLYYKTINSKILITNDNVANIVESNEKEAFYVAGDTLYYVHLDKGISKVMRYSEWNFTNNNIYIF